MGNPGCSGYIGFLMAGHKHEDLKPVRPSDGDLGGLDVLAGKGTDSDDESEVGEEYGEVCERIKLPREEDCLRRIKDPKLPSQKEVEEHALMGHLPYRDWCHFCIQARGRDTGHLREKGKERKLSEYS